MKLLKLLKSTFEKKKCQFVKACKVDALWTESLFYGNLPNTCTPRLLSQGYVHNLFWAYLYYLMFCIVTIQKINYLFIMVLPHSESPNLFFLTINRVL